MRSENQRRNNVRRLAYCLFQRKDDPQIIRTLAAALDYMPEQLREDIADLETYTAEKVREDREEIED